MDHRRQGQYHRPPPGGAAFACEHSKKNGASLLKEWESLWEGCQAEVCSRLSCAERLHDHLLAHLVCPGRHTLTGLITTFGKQFEDWSADYSLYSKNRVDEEVIFRQVRRETERLVPDSRPLCVALDDTILRKTGKRIPGAAYRKDPLGPAFNLNLIWAQRMQQISAAVADENNAARMIPIGYRDASTPRKPRKGSAPEQFEFYKEQMKQRNLNALAVESLRRLQAERASDNGGSTPGLHVLVDGSYTNRKMLRNLPGNTTLIGRIRKDARLCAKPEAKWRNPAKKNDLLLRTSSTNCDVNSGPRPFVPRF